MVTNYSYRKLFWLVLLASLAFANPHQGYGQYQRKSVTVLSIPALIQIPEDLKSPVTALLESKLYLPRFDVNFDSGNMKDMVTGLLPQDPSKVEIAKALNTALLQPLLSGLDSTSHQRAIESLSSADLNSWAVERAKLDGVTASHIQRIYESAYIIIPQAYYYQYSQTDRFVGEASMIVGFYLYQLQDDSLGYFSIRFAGSISENFSASAGGLIWTHDAANSALLRVLDDNIQTLLRKCPDFQMNAQVIEVEKRNYSADIDVRNDIAVDDFYDRVDIQANGDSIVTGFGIVRSTGDTSSKEFVKLTSMRGMPITGQIVRERVVSRQQLGFGLSMWDGNPGAQLSYGYNIGPSLGLNQFYIQLKVNVTNPILLKAELSKGLSIFPRTFQCLQIGYMLAESPSTQSPYAGISNQFLLNPNWIWYTDVAMDFQTKAPMLGTGFLWRPQIARFSFLNILSTVFYGMLGAV